MSEFLVSVKSWKLREGSCEEQQSGVEINEESTILSALADITSVMQIPQCQV